METAHIKLNGQFTAIEMDEILKRLAETRAAMQPAVPTTPPTLDSTAEALVNDGSKPTLFTVRTRIDGGLRIWLRSEGFGWLALQLTAADRKQLAHLISDQVAHTHTAH